MNRDTIEGSGKQFTGKVKAQWGKLTNHQLDVIDRKCVDVSGKVQEDYGITRDATEQQIEHFNKPDND
ncbi:CsbD family protein [Sedimenticola sp.]|uniref:CsbD family protein n=1 Tax=Sedimenticola sp. TaxID=1940285 RepID=UPI00258E735E|nr:CsbD family protein [Sedimenticola sp.]MCW8903819.1 hypothetical protein [Sedimenticola sp.]